MRAGPRIKICSNCIAVQADDDRMENKHWNANASFKQCQKGRKHADLYCYSVLLLTGWTRPEERM